MAGGCIRKKTKDHNNSTTIITTITYLAAHNTITSYQ